MSVFSKVKDFLSRHRNKIVVGGVIITGSIFLTKYAQQRIKEWQEKETMEFLERNRKQHHFESISRTCNQTIINLSATLIDVILKTVNTEDVIESLKSNPENKLEIWNNLKVSVFTKAGCTIYALVMLVVTLRIQLNIVGGYLYKDPTSVTTEMQEKYLSVSQFFLNEGFTRLSKMMEKEVKKVIESIELTKQLRLSDLEAIFWSLQTAVATNDCNPIENLRDYVCQHEVPYSNDLYRNILRDTADLLESDEVKSLATHCINRGFILLVDQISEFYNQNGSTIKELPLNSVGENFKNPFDIKKPLAKLLPIINGLLSKQSYPSHFIQQLITNEKLQILGANVYESLL